MATDVERFEQIDKDYKDSDPTVAAFARMTEIFRQMGLFCGDCEALLDPLSGSGMVKPSSAEG